MQPDATSKRKVGPPAGGAEGEAEGALPGRTLPVFGSSLGLPPDHGPPPVGSYTGELLGGEEGRGRRGGEEKAAMTRECEMILVGARKMCLQPASSKHAALISSADSFLGLKSLAIPHRVLLPEPGSNPPTCASARNGCFNTHADKSSS
ncbi:unnamed protein product [Prorocentrum cordatum]|uniref:Uncharacterized protein n=1 Tax=Prorocentrum cordatum TaxID=2364126 RepID=A0ABN9PLV8_9DINO|nr:unnamed protein product [Polarella glacialis]